MKRGLTKDLETALAAPWLLSAPEYPKGTGGANKLIQAFNHQLLPGHWRVLIFSTHTQEQSFLWLAAKETLARLGKGENLLLGILAAEREDWFQLLILLRRNKRKLNFASDDQRYPEKERNSFLQPNLLLRRILSGYTPKFRVQKHWLEIISPPVQYVGVGYKDKGSLPTAPSWRDQVVETEEGIPPPDDEIFLLRSLLSFLEFLSARGEQEFQLTRPTRRSKRKKRKKVNADLRHPES